MTVFFNVRNQGFYHSHCSPFWRGLGAPFPLSKKLFQAGMALLWEKTKEGSESRSSMHFFGQSERKETIVCLKMRSILIIN